MNTVKKIMGFFWITLAPVIIYLLVRAAIQNIDSAGTKDINKTRLVYKQCIDIIPHKVFTFGKIWLMAAYFEIRQKDITAARKLLGYCIGLCGGKENIFKGYIELELQLGEIERCRNIYIKYLELMPYNCNAWKSFAQLEINVGEINRVKYFLYINIDSFKV
jgi:crooked neck